MGNCKTYKMQKILKYVIGALLLNTASAICEYDIGQTFDEFGNLTSGFGYWSVWNDTEPGTYAGVAHLEIPLPPGYRSKDWTVQLRRPLELEKIQCFTDAIRMKDCDGACEGTKIHYHITPHFWDANVDKLGIEMMPTWNGVDYTPEAYNDGPIPCVDWCDDGKVPEWRGPCNGYGTPTASPTISPDDCDAKCYSEFFTCMDNCAGDSVCSSSCSSDHFQCVTNCHDPDYVPPTTTTEATTTTTTPEDCDANCYTEFFDCMNACAGDSICSSDCSRLHFECVTICHDPDYVPPTTTTTTTTQSTTQSPEECDAGCYEKFFACMDECSGDSLCSSKCSQSHLECIAICHDPDYVPPTTQPTTTTTTTTTTTKSTTTTTKNPILICDNNCYEDHDNCVRNCRRHDEECIELCHIENTQCLAKCHDPDFVPSTKPTTQTTTTIRTTTTTRTTTPTTTTTTTEFDVAACDDACYDEYFKCLAACGYKITDPSDLEDIDQMDACSNSCNDANFECMISCHNQ